MTEPVQVKEEPAELVEIEISPMMLQVDPQYTMVACRPGPSSIQATGPEQDLPVVAEVGTAGHIDIMMQPPDVLYSTLQRETAYSSLPPEEPDTEENHRTTAEDNVTERNKCLKCNKIFSRGYRLKMHMMIHTGEKKFKCIMCHKGFYEAYSLKRHMLIHTSEKPFKCLECNRPFLKAYDLKRHLLVHFGEKTFKCSKCEQSFYSSTKLKSHMYIHSDERIFNCTECDETFHKATHLNKHMLTHS